MRRSRRPWALAAGLAAAALGSAAGCRRAASRGPAVEFLGEKFTPVAGAAAFPAAVRSGLAAKFLDDPRLSDPGGPFDAGDTKTGAPSRRMVFGALSERSALVCYEHGGRGLHAHAAVLSLTGDVRFAATLPRPPASIEELDALLKSGLLSNEASAFEHQAEAAADAFTPPAPPPEPPPPPGTVWPNAESSANSDPWLAAHHGDLRRLEPRFLVVNFAVCQAAGGGDNCFGGPFPVSAAEHKAAEALQALKRASAYQPSLRPGARPLLRPVLERFVSVLSGAHANSGLLPRGEPDPETGFAKLDYARLFSKDFAPYWGFKEKGRDLTLGQAVDRGLVNDVVILANRVDPKPDAPPDQVTLDVPEVLWAAKSWTKRRLRIFFLDASKGTGCLVHALGRDVQARLTGPSADPAVRKAFRRFAGFDLDTRLKAPFQSLYQDDHGCAKEPYAYPGCSDPAACALRYPAPRRRGKPGALRGYTAGCGSVDYPPGAACAGDYAPAAAVPSFCESFQQDDEEAKPFDRSKWEYLTSDASVDKDCGGDFVTYWLQNMPPEWWPYLYY